MEDAESVLVIQKLLHDNGYKAQVFDDQYVSSAASGLKFFVIPYTKSLQFRCSIGNVDEDEVNLNFLNEINKENRFYKAYLDNKNNFVLESDWWIDLSINERMPQFANAMHIWEIALANTLTKLRDFNKNTKIQK